MQCNIIMLEFTYMILKKANFNHMKLNFREYKLKLLYSAGNKQKYENIVLINMFNCTFNYNKVHHHLYKKARMKKYELMQFK